MGATGTAVRVSRAYHRYPGKPCFVQDLKSPPERKLHFDQRSRRWVSIVLFGWLLLVVLGAFRLMLNHAGSSVYLFEPSSRQFNASSTLDFRRRPIHKVEFGNTLDNKDFDFDVPPVRSDDTLIHPKTPASSLVVLVLSKRDHFQRRSMIRQTWGKAYASSLYFVIGGGSYARRGNSTSDEVQRLLIEEQVRHWDLLDTVHPESYHGLPHKLRFAIRWVMRHHWTVRWILKVDDDMYVRSLNGFVRRNRPLGLSILNSSLPVVMGQIQYLIPVQRHGKWAEDVSYYQHHPVYPPWPKGSSGYLMSRSVGMLIAQKYNQDLSLMKSSLKDNVSLPTYQGEDTSLGIWLEASNVSWINSEYFVNHGRCLPGVDNAWSIGHRITPELMQKCYEAESKLIWSIDPSIEDTTILEALPISQDQRFTNVKDASTDSEAFRSAVLHNELDQKSVVNIEAMEQRRQQREAKRHEQQLFRFSNNKL
jgi:Galactosyltransferase